MGEIGETRHILSAAGFFVPDYYLGIKYIVCM